MERTKIAFLILTAAAGLLAAAPGRADENAPADAPRSVEERLQALEQRDAVLERRLENDRDSATAASKTSSTATTGSDGFQIRSNDGAYALRVSGILQFDERSFLQDGNTLTDQFLLRRIRPTFEGKLATWIGFRVTPDFANGGGTTSGPTSSLLPDAYVDLSLAKALNLRAGKFKPPVGLEALLSDAQLPFNERSVVSQLVPNRDTGLELSGDIADGRWVYQAAILNGVADGATGETDSNDQKDYEGRVFLRPFKPASSEWINGLGFGVAGSAGRVTGNAAASGLTGGYRSDGQQTFFSYQSGAVADGSRRRISPQAYWSFSHVGVLAEYVASSQDIRRVTASTQTATITNRAWQVEGSWVLTGERQSFTGLKPRHAFDPKNHGWGAWEIVGRYAHFQADDDAFAEGFASLSTSASKARSWATGLNWYLNGNMRVNADYSVTSFVGGASAGNRPTEKALLNRFQVTF